MEKKEELPFIETPIPELEKKETPDTEGVSHSKRGWTLDVLVRVGHLEAGLSHIDEEISNLKEKLSKVGSSREVTEIVDKIARNEEVAKLDYERRVELMNDLFDSLDGDWDYYCPVKHKATDYAIACEVFHSRGFRAEDEESMFKAAQSLALTCSLAFGFEPFSCLRCMDERTQNKK